MSLPILPTTVVGSYSMPGWLERLKTEYFARRISRQELDEIHDASVKAAIKDQEVAGLDVITDGELRRDNMIDYFAERLPGVQTDHTSKKFYVSTTASYRQALNGFAPGYDVSRGGYGSGEQVLCDGSPLALQAHQGRALQE
jgi:methionine synthase II (cobalamin-independent)